MYRIGNTRNLCKVRKLDADRYKNVIVLKILKTNFTSTTFSGLMKRFHPGNKGKNKLLNKDNVKDKQIVRQTCADVITTDCNVGGVVTKDCFKGVPPPSPCELVQPIKWPKCKRICLKCCKPPVLPNDCSHHRIKLNNCKGIKYKFPAFTTTAKQVPSGFSFVADCCYWDECCRRVNIGNVKQKKTTLERQKEVLGYRKRNVSSLLRMKARDETGCRKFSTFTALLQKTGDGCEPQGIMRCLKIDLIALKKVPKVRKSCERLCMPCCRPAREPPLCSTVFMKQSCIKLKPPRPSFSECQNILVDPDKCECQAPPVRCTWGKKNDDDVNGRKI